MTMNDNDGLKDSDIERNHNHSNNDNSDDLLCSLVHF